MDRFGVALGQCYDERGPVGDVAIQAAALLNEAGDGPAGVLVVVFRFRPTHAVSARLLRVSRVANLDFVLPAEERGKVPQGHSSASLIYHIL